MPRLDEPRQARIKNERFGQIFDIGNANAAIVPVGTIATNRSISMPQCRRVSNAGNLLILVFQADQRGQQRDTATETERAVDGIDDPAKGGRARRVAELLAEK